MLRALRPGFPLRHLLAILLLAALVRALLLVSGSVSFHADEAIVGLMARHILDGARPTFFYGQAYMGSLDAWLVAVGFALLGESVLVIRLVQSALYLLVVAAGYAAAWRLTARPVVAAVAGLTLAVPTPNVALYTTATLGGYNEVLLLGSLVLLLGWGIYHDFPHSAWRWALLGLCAGLGWWTHGLIVIYALPVAALLFYRTLIKPAMPRRAGFVMIGLALAGFVIGSAPWWVFDIQHHGAAISTFLASRQSGEFTGIGLPDVPPGQRALGLLLVGLPTLIGLRFPWSEAYFLLPVGALVLPVYAAAFYRLLRGGALVPDVRLLLLGLFVLFGLVFVASSFGADPTGRYFLPLALPLGIVLGTLVDAFITQASGQSPAPGWKRAAAFVPAALVILYQAAGLITAASGLPGFTTQFDPVSHIPNDHDAELISFLETNDLFHGYTNYWVVFRLAFLSGERLQYSAALPYKTSLDYNPADNRYRPYVEATAAAERVAYITANLPELAARLESAFQAQGLTYSQYHLGVFTIFYGFEPHNPAGIRFP
ncbi:MAG: glycosyltransferase family 39 protein [Chloroflexi bacterium]|nr:glycosyltransferase family 39 protein [Chloroflexota bacterium]